MMTLSQKHSKPDPAGLRLKKEKKNQLLALLNITQKLHVSPTPSKTNSLRQI